MLTLLNGACLFALGVLVCMFVMGVYVSRRLRAIRVAAALAVCTAPHTRRVLCIGPSPAAVDIAWDQGEYTRWEEANTREWEWIQAVAEVPVHQRVHDAPTTLQ